MITTAEAVTAWHPDKICDQVSDAILDACLDQDPNSRVAIETLGGHGTLVLMGEITTLAVVDYASVAKEVYFNLTKKNIGALTNITTQSPNISTGVDKGGAGDQGIMIGYACNENEMYIPNELYLAKKILAPFETDGKSQVTLIDGVIDKIVLSVQGKSKKELMEWLNSEYDPNPGNYYCNNTGSFKIGGFDADSGCTGRKIVCDSYGPRVPVGGGAFSGKDPTKVDRSGAYMARYIALDVLNYYMGKEVIVKLAYVIGKDEPVMKLALLDGKEVDIKHYDCRPEAIIDMFDLKKPIYEKTARQGHFGYKEYPWEKI